MNENDLLTWQTAMVAVGTIALASLVLVVLIWQIGATWRARMLVAREEAYRALAAEAAEAQQRTADLLERTAAELDDLRARTTELERMLKEVG